MIFLPSGIIIILTIWYVLGIPYGTMIDRWLVWIVLAELIVPTVVMRLLTGDTK